MTAVTVTKITQMSPNCGVKEVVVKCSMATGEVWTATNYFTTIYGCQLQNAVGAVRDVTFSGLVVTMGSLSTGQHSLRVWGV